MKAEVLVVDDGANARRALVRLVTNETDAVAEIADDEQALERLLLTVLAEATLARVRQVAAVLHQDKWSYLANLAAARQYCVDVRPVLVDAAKRIVRTRQFLAARADDPHLLRMVATAPPPPHTIQAATDPSWSPEEGAGEVGCASGTTPSPDRRANTGNGVAGT